MSMRGTIIERKRCCTVSDPGDFGDKDKLDPLKLLRKLELNDLIPSIKLDMKCDETIKLITSIEIK
jgi:hypothetical protein